jgi:NitT/TauT family transport system permease protein
MPPLIWNMMMSMSGGWFFVVVSEAITVGNTTVTLPGVGSYIALAIEQRNVAAIGYAIAAMFVVILIYDQLLFRPLIASADWFRLEQESGALTPSRSWALTMMRRSRLINVFARLFAWILSFRRSSGQAIVTPAARRQGKAVHSHSRLGDVLWYSLIAVIGFCALIKTVRFVLSGVPAGEVVHVLVLGLITLLRVVVLIAIASVIWVPIGMAIGLRPRVARIAQPIAQFLAAFPAILFFPVVVSGIVLLRLNPNIWLSPLMILGTQWYILFNVIVGATALPAELRYVGENLRVGGWLWWKRIGLPAVFPYYLTGAITASGGSWNASIAAEVAVWGHEKLVATGLGSYIAAATDSGDYQRVALGTVMMSLFVVLINRFFWRPLYTRAERKFRLN